MKGLKASSIVTQFDRHTVLMRTGRRGERRAAMMVPEEIKWLVGFVTQVTRVDSSPRCPLGSSPR